MPRGAGKDGNNSPIIGENGVHATPAELTALTRNMRENFIKDLSRPPIDLHDPEQVKQAVIDYFIDCEQAGKRPGNMGLYRALNLTRQDVNNALTGKSKAKISAASLDILKRAIGLLGEYREQLGAQGKLNPVTMIFWQKNFDHLTDVQVVEHTISQEDTPILTQEELNKRIPVYSDIDIAGDSDG